MDSAQRPQAVSPSACTVCSSPGEWPSPSALGLLTLRAARAAMATWRAPLQGLHGVKFSPEEDEERVGPSGGIQPAKFHSQRAR